MKDKAVSPAMIAGAVVVLLIIIAGIWAMTRPKTPLASSEYRPDYTKPGVNRAPYGPQSGGGSPGGPGYGGQGAPGSPRPGSSGYGQPPGPR